MIKQSIPLSVARNPSPWKRLTTSAFWANVPFLSLLLMLDLLHQALSLMIGMCLGLTSYWLLYRDLSRAVRLLKLAGRPVAQGSLSWAQTGRFFFVAAVLLLLFLFVPVVILYLLLGYLVTQIAVSVTVLRIGTLFQDF